MITTGNIWDELAMRPMEKFATQVDAQTLAQVRALARAEGRLLQSLVGEALADLMEKRAKSSPRPDVMAAYEASHQNFAPLYKKLAE